MTMADDIQSAWKEAMKARDPKKDVLTLIRTEFKSAAMDNRAPGSSDTTPSDEVAMKVLKKMAKQRRESVAEFKKAGRDDLLQKEQAELDVIASYLPAEMSDDALMAIVTEVIESVGATSMADMGKIMGPAMAKVAGQADGKRVQAAVRQKLA